MCARGRRQLPAFDFLAHLLLDNHVMDFNYNVTQRLVDSQKQSVKSSELTADITLVHLVTGPFLLYYFYPQVTLCLVDLTSKYKN